jgi:hypothetical protein
LNSNPVSDNEGCTFHFNESQAWALRQRDTESGKRKRAQDDEDDNFLFDEIDKLSLDELSEGEEEEA